MNIYIGGDSFCFHRDNLETDWPLILANKLNLMLQGVGIPGHSWWHTRKDLVKYKSTELFQSTDIFVICHSEPNRMLIDATSEMLDYDKIKATYLKYFHSEDISAWTTQQWYKELNSLLENKKVLHVQCFTNTAPYFYLLNGLKHETPLIELSLAEVNHIDQFLYDNRRNHFSRENNHILADKFYNLLTK